MPSTSLASGPIIDTSRSPHARLRSLPLAAARLTDAFWAPRLEINRSVTLPSQYRQCEQTGRIDNFRRASGKKQIDFQGIYFNDSDVYKWMEACAFALAERPDPEIESMLESVAREVQDAQDADGYLNTYFTFERTRDRWTNLRDLHELYCAGHFMQAAVAHHRATGRTELLGVATRLADHIAGVFGPSKRPGAPGHEEIEMALVELYRVTNEPRYLDQAAFFIDQRGRKPGVIGGSPYHQDHRPVREQTEVVGHAVRALYLCSGAADLVAETGEPALRQALDALWSNMVERRAYVTGGLGARYEGEAFGADYELPNDRAYTETCAAIASVMWNWRLLQMEGDARYADLMEHTLYNAVLPGLSLDGTRYFYQNPLANRGGHRRQEWFGCACCPPNVSRLLASLPGYFYGVSDDGAWVHLYAAGSAAMDVPGGHVTLEVQTDYPWDGELAIRVTDPPGTPWTLHLRIPGWCADPSLAINGKPEVPSPGSYAAIRREWQDGDIVRLSLPMPVRRIESHPHVLNNRGRVAVQRGPILYCLEGADHPGLDVWDIALPADAGLSSQWEPELLGGVTVLTGTGLALDTRRWQGRLYRTAGDDQPARPIPIRAIPYYAWANREPGAMQVWLPAVEDSVTVQE